MKHSNMVAGAVRWLLLVVAACVALVGLSVANGAFDLAMDEDIGTLSGSLKEGGLNAKQAEAVIAAFRSTQYNVRHFVANVTYALTTALAVAWVAAVLVGRIDHAKANGADGQPARSG